MIKYILIFGLFTALMPLNVGAYNDVVHYYTTGIVMRYIAPAVTDAEMKVVTFCAQLPDETLEYDAARQYRKFAFGNRRAYAKWARADFGDSAMKEVIESSVALRELITVQQLLHGLTGGNATELLAAAEEILRNLAHEVSWGQDDPQESEKICAVGFAVHLLGDTLAHRQLDSGDLSAPGVMYETGAGHFRDGKRPDYLLKSVTGLEGWKRYNNQFPLSLPGDRALDGNGLQDLNEKLKAADEKWFRSNAAAREAVLDEAEGWPIHQKFAPKLHKNEACQLYVNEVFSTLVPKMCTPQCRTVWKIFADKSMQEFHSEDIDRKPKLAVDSYEYPSIAGEALACPPE